MTFSRQLSNKRVIQGQSEQCPKIRLSWLCCPLATKRLNRLTKRGIFSENWHFCFNDIFPSTVKEASYLRSKWAVSKNFSWLCRPLAAKRLNRLIKGGHFLKIDTLGYIFVSMTFQRQLSNRRVIQGQNEQCPKINLSASSGQTTKPIN